MKKIIAAGAAGAALAAAAAVVTQVLPDLRRYLRMRRM
ncbi:MULTISPECIES: DUF6893 family small protein [unclassified Streptomyces]